MMLFDVGSPFLSVHAHLAKPAPDLLLLGMYHQYELSHALLCARPELQYPPQGGCAIPHST